MKKSISGQLTVITRIVLLALASYSTEAATVLFQSKGDALKQSQLSIGWDFIGLMGDLVDLDDGTHKISVNAPRGYTLQFALTIRGNVLNVASPELIPQNCTEELDVNWRRPDVVDSTEYENVKVIILNDPEFGAPTGDVLCMSSAMAGCTKRKIILTAKSEPNGAEIRIDGKKIQHLTNATLSVPYCEYESSKNITLRMDGKINCKKTILLSPDSVVSIICNFSEPSPIN